MANKRTNLEAKAKALNISFDENTTDDQLDLMIKGAGSDDAVAKAGKAAVNAHLAKEAAGETITKPKRSVKDSILNKYDISAIRFQVGGRNYDLSQCRNVADADAIYDLVKDLTKVIQVKATD